MKKYESYKDSVIEWIGEVPEHWVSKRLKYVFDTVIGGAWGDEPMSNENDMVVFRVADFDYGKGVLSTDNLTIRNIPESQQNNRVLKYGDIILEKSGGGEKTPVGRAVMYTHEQIQSVCANFCNRLSTKNEYDPAFVNYMFKYLYNKGVTLKYINQTTGIQNLQSEALLNEAVFIPTFDEQNSIANFLDDKTSQIDSLIQKKQQMIALLEEEKTAVINEAVTKGLNPDAPMKDSGIEWLGMVPAHWILSKIAYVSTVVRGASPRPAGSPKYFNGSHTPWITVAEVTKDDSKYITSVSSYLTEEGREQSRFIEAGTLVLSNSGATLGVPKILRIGGCINDGSVAFLNLRNSINQDFLYYFFKSLTFTYREMMKGSGQPNLNTDIVKSTNIAVPPVEEQLTIVQHIEDKIGKCNFTISRIRQEIELMQEYRTALISEVVTGKIDVRDYQPEPITSTALA